MKMEKEFGETDSSDEKMIYLQTYWKKKYHTKLKLLINRCVKKHQIKKKDEYWHNFNSEKGATGIYQIILR